MSAISKSNSCAQSPRGIMTRLAKDKRGATLPMMAAAIVPIAAMVGAGLDMSRVYLVRTRLQQACDAGSVAVRRSMSATNTATASPDNKTEGYKFFDFNFPQGAYGTEQMVRTYTGVTTSAGVGNVDGQASVVVPTSVMKLFAIDTMTVSVSCAATVSIPNTDVMFVLDVSGSMSDTVAGDSISKLQALKDATNSFFTTLGKGSATGGGRIRYGFVPYSSQANTGAVVKAASPSYILGGTTGETATYRSRSAIQNYITGYQSPSGHTPNGTPFDRNLSNNSWSDVGTNNGSSTLGGPIYLHRFTGITSANCAAKPKPFAGNVPANVVNTPTSSVGAPALISATTPIDPTDPDDVRINSYESSQNFDRDTYTYSWTSSNGGTCRLRRNDQTFVRVTPTKTTQVPNWATNSALLYWIYHKRSIDVTSLVAGNSIANPAYWSGISNDPLFNANPTPNASSSQPNVSSNVSWSGCLEESSTVNTITTSSSMSIPDDALDMQIDLLPDTVSEKWRPFLPQVVFDKTGLTGTSARWHADSNWNNSDRAACPTAARELRQYTGDNDATKPDTFAGYVKGLTAKGLTQHDIGMIWGARMLSPDGILASSNNVSPGGFAISRHLVFMTDGIMNADNDNYGPWGIARLDGRQVPKSTSSGTMDSIHNHRLKMICESARSKGYTVWVIGFGMTATTMPQTLKDCAGSVDKWMAAPKAADLKTKFGDIASTIGGLRLTE
jgi:Flp pilus assembly protein TadG